MSETPAFAVTPPAYAAVDRIPILLQQVQSSLVRQVKRINERTGNSFPYAAAIARIEHTARDMKSGLLRVEGPQGSGITTLLCQLALLRPYAFWLGDDDAGQGVSALCAQLIGLHHLPVPLVPPAATSDARILEALLDAATHRRTSDAPLIVVVDALIESYLMRYPTAPLFPAQLPPNVVIVYGCAPGTASPPMPTVRLTLPQSDVLLDALRATVDTAFSKVAGDALVERSAGNMLYLRIAQGLLRSSFLALEQLPNGLDALHEMWWNQLDATGRRLAVALTAASEPLPDDLCATLIGSDPALYFRQWGTIIERFIGGEEESISAAAFYHQATRAFVRSHSRSEVAQIHGDLALLGRRDILDEQPRNEAHLLTSSLSWEAKSYLLKEYARHTFFSPPRSRAALLPTVASRPWVRLQQRRGTALAAARDAAWELRGAVADGPLVRLVRSAFLAGSLATLARSLPTAAPAEALLLALDTPERDTTLKQILAICDQLPDGREKAPLLRRLGEVCYGERRMRTTAMRLLSQALDMEGQLPPKIWRDEREQVLAAFGRAVLAQGDWKDALEITPRIGHIERRGMVETDVVRYLIRAQSLETAASVVHGIAHESLRAWAQAEIAVAFANAGDIQRADALLDGISSETANAWAQIELACDEARFDENAATLRIERLDAQNQRDRGWARLAHALAQYDKDGDALAMAERIHDVATRVDALLNLRLTLDGLVAMLALEQATAVISALTGDDRVPLIAALAAAHAALGRRERALAIVAPLEAEEERDRAYARVAVALGGNGDYEQGQHVVALIGDSDERDWALDELAQMLGRVARWEEAYQRANELIDQDQRAKTVAELMISQGQQGDPVAAYRLAQSMDHQAERVRALTALVPFLTRAGQFRLALAAQESMPTPDARSRYQTALVHALLEQSSGLDSKQSVIAWTEARRLALTIRRSPERVRSLIALAHASIDQKPDLAQSTLGLAFQTASGSRGETLLCLEIAATTLARLGGPRLLVDSAAAIEDVDTWLQG